jgi:hypothetical protein
MQKPTGKMEMMKDWSSYHCPSLKPLQDLSNELTGDIDSRTVCHLTQGRDVPHRRLFEKTAVLAAEL